MNFAVNRGGTINGFDMDLKSKEPISLELNNVKTREAFTLLSEVTGINFLIDEEVKDKVIFTSIREENFRDSLDILLNLANLRRKVISDNTVVIYPKTEAKIHQYEDLLVKVFYLSHIDAAEAAELLQGVMLIDGLHIYKKLNALLIRDSSYTVGLVEELLRQTDLADAEVMLTLEVLEINTTKSDNLGLDFTPDTLTAAVPTTGGVITLDDLRKLASGDLLVTLPTAVLNIKREDIDVNILANPKIRVKNKHSANIHIGERIPIVTTTTNQGVSTETIEYIDIGLKLTVEPLIKPNDDIELKIRLERSSLGTKTVTTNGSITYQIGTRNTETTLSLHDGEIQVIGGLISEEDRSTVSKVPLLGDIPLLGRLFSSNDLSKVKTDILLYITPHIVKRVEIPKDIGRGQKVN